MSAPPTRLPQPDAGLFLTDGGLETTLIVDRGVDLPDFAAFPLLDDAGGRAELERYYDAYAQIAVRDRRGIVLETPTWRANPDWGARLGYDAAALAAVNRAGVELLRRQRDRHETASTPVVVSGCLGPRGDGYVVADAMTAEQARAYHAPQVTSLADAGVDLVCALTLNYVEEAVGIALAARDADVPVVLSFTVETDGRLATGMSLGDAVEAVDGQTSGYPAYYMVNCAHPSHVLPALDASAPWAARLGGIRANASRRSHAELDAAETLDRGDPAELAQEYRALAAVLPGLRVVGGCCGTDDRHVDAISRALPNPARTSAPAG